MYLEAETYYNRILNNKAAKQCLECFADPSHPCRALWIDGASGTGKTFIRQWFDANIQGCETILIDVQDNASIQAILGIITDQLSAMGYPLPNYQSTKKPRPMSFSTDISGVSVIDSKDTFVGVQVSLAQNANELMIVYQSQVDAIVADISSHSSPTAPRIVLMFDHMDRFDSDTKGFIYFSITPSLNRTGIFQFLYAGKGEASYLQRVPDRILRQTSLSIELLPLTDPSDIVVYLQRNGGEYVKGRDLYADARNILKAARGSTSAALSHAQVLCGVSVS